MMNAYKHYYERRLQLGKELNKKKVIYLDTNYWLNLRDVVLERNKKPNWKKLFEILASEVEDGKAVLPISRETVIEVASQSDPQTFSKTVEIIDQLSTGVCVIPPDERRQEEIFNVVRALTQDVSKFPSLSNSVWTRFNFCICSVHEVLPTIVGNQEKINWIDETWNRTMLQQTNDMGISKIRSLPRFPDLSSILNERKIALAGSVNSRKEIYLSELVHILDECRYIIDQLVNQGRIGFSKTLDRTNLIDDLHEEASEMIYSLCKDNEAVDELPSFHIITTIISAVCWDRARKFKRTDWLDFSHAEAAIPYSDVFMTEKSLKAVLTRSDIAMNHIYRCTIISSVEDAVKCLASKSYSQC